MRVLVTGATGFIGRALCARLVEAGAHVVALSRRPPREVDHLLPRAVRVAPWPEKDETAHPTLEGFDAVVHLAGEPIAGGRWTPARKQLIRASRVETTRTLVAALGRLDAPPSAFLTASAVGFYGDRGDEPLTEESPPGADFLASVCQEWEEQAQEASHWGARVVRLRFGLVLGRGGALAKMLPFFRAGLGGRLGSGRQWMSWIHLQDAVELVYLLLNDPALSGPFNVTAPNPVRNTTFTAALGQVLRRPAVLPVPAALLRLAFGEMSSTLLASQRALPQRALNAGYAFRHPTLTAALEDILAKPS